MSRTALTARGIATIEPDVALPNIKVGDLVLGTPNPDTEPLRTLYRVVKPYGNYRAPLEPPASWLGRLAALAGRKRQGILVDLVTADPCEVEPTPAMFAAASNPTLDRVTGLS
jgi:hypothetical protein